MPDRPRTLILLSEKSSGSSALQRQLVQTLGARTVTHTRHFESETLYWTKAASLLGLPQRKMVDSEVPLSAAAARRDLLALLKDNVPAFEVPASDRALIRDGWRALCRAHAPIFIEKSPHHLCQWSVLELTLEHVRQLSDIDSMLIGLIRNPLAVIRSQFRRWGSSPEAVEEQWRVAYTNLRRLRDRGAAELLIVRYEDIVASQRHLERVYGFCGVQPAEVAGALHRESVDRWRSDELFGFQLSAETVQLAESYGYSRHDLTNTPHVFWPLVRAAGRTRGRFRRTLRRATQPRRSATFRP